MKTNFSFKQFTVVGLSMDSGFAIPGCKSQAPKELPNILWIVSEDNSAYFTGCYGNDFATTPNIDRLAGQGFMYTHAYATCAVSAPSRNTILTGVYAASNGNENMRSTFPTSDIVRGYIEYMRSAGYYCTNNSKTDYNTSDRRFEESWDESSNTAHYLNRPEGKPFFAVFNSMLSHESSIFRQIPNDKLRHDPEKVALPPYHPDTPEMRHDWAEYYDCIEDMDTWVGGLLHELDSLGLADNTIVVYYGDNGGVLARSKRFIYETGTQIPLVIRIPEKYKYLYPAKKPGSKVDRLVNFVDLTPTLLSIAGVSIPEYIQGKAFLGKQKTEDPEYTYFSRQRMDERYDLVRSVRDKKYQYIRNSMPFRITMQHVAFLFNAPSAQSWEDAFKAGKTNEVQSMFFLPKPVEELYDVDIDYWEIHNLADDPAYADVMERMRNALDQWEKDYYDVGLVPETDYNFYLGSASMYDYMRSPECPIDKLLEASRLATLGGAEDIGKYIEYLKDDNSAVRYWGVTGLLIHKDNAQEAIPELIKLTGDRSASVATLSAETLYNLGEKDAAIKAYVNLLRDTVNYNMTDRNFALNSIDAINDASQEIISAVRNLYDEKNASVQGFARYSSYDLSMSEYLLRKWGVLTGPPQTRGI